MLERLPPHDILAEESVVASLLVDPDAAGNIAPILDAADFFREVNAWTYAACIALWQRGITPDQITVAHELEQRGKLEDVGGLSFLSELTLNLPTPVGAENYANIVRNEAIRRRLIEAGERIIRIAYDEPNAEDALGRAGEALSTLQGATTVAKGFVLLSHYLDPFMEPPDSEAFTPYQGHVRTGLADLDALLVGLNPSDLIIVAARTGVGKTALMLNMARNAAVGQQAKVAIFSLEMSGDQLAQRLLAAEASVDSRRLRLGTHNEAEEHRIMHAHGVLSDAQIYIDDSYSLRVGDMRGRLQGLISEAGGLDLVVVDYLQLMDGERRRDANRVQEVGHITRSLKQLAREFDVPIVTGSQLSRATEQRAGHVPMLSDLRESGSIEQDADVVLFIHREEVYTTREDWHATHPDKARHPYPEGLAQLIVAKHRNGPVATVDVRFEKSFSRFGDLGLPNEPGSTKRFGL